MIDARIASRRAFLVRSAATLAAGSSLGLISSLAGCSGSAGAPPAPQGLPWNELARELSGSLVRPGDQGFAALALPNNLRYASTLPGGIALCKNAQDVSASILWARANGVPLVARSGGHSYAGYSTTTGLMIDVREMTSFAFDRASGIATFGGGARNKNVYDEGRKAGVAVTHGRCHNVGIAGLTLGGGVGFNMRAHGTLCDQLVRSEIVTADGTIHEIDATHDAHGLFWACRGAGGGNYGVNTSLSYQTFPVDRITAFNLWWDKDEESIFAALAAALELAPDALGSKVSATVSPPASSNGTPRTVVELIGQLYGTPEQVRDILGSVYAVATPSRGYIKETSYWDGQDLLSEEGPPEYYQERSRFFETPIDNAACTTIFDWLRRWPATAKAATFKMFQTGGKMNAIAPNATAFVHRSSHWLGSVALNWEHDTPPAALEENLAWQSRFYEAVVELAGGGAYQNFIDPSLGDWETAYYGDNIARLKSIKRSVDPHRVFNFPEAIP